MNVYYLPGFGGQLRTGLGEGLIARGWNPVGRETRGEFRRLTFTEQVNIVRNDLIEHHWHKDCKVIANSFGAYLFLHAQSEMPPYIGSVILLSPIVGDFYDGAKAGFSPPQPSKIRDLVSKRLMPRPQSCEIHVGSDDWQSDPGTVRGLADALSIPVTVLPNMGHMLDKAYVGALLDRWLRSQSN